MSTALEPGDLLVFMFENILAMHVFYTAQ